MKEALQASGSHNVSKAFQFFQDKTFKKNNQKSQVPLGGSKEKVVAKPNENSKSKSIVLSSSSAFSQHDEISDLFAVEGAGEFDG